MPDIAGSLKSEIARLSKSMGKREASRRLEELAQEPAR